MKMSRNAVDRRSVVVYAHNLSKKVNLSWTDSMASYDQSVPSGTSRPPRPAINYYLGTSVLCLLLATPALSQETKPRKDGNASDLKAFTLEPIVIDVQDGDAGVVAKTSRVGMKADASILETPQSVSVITRDQMDTQNPANTSSALRYTAGATSEAFGAFGSYVDITRIRGIKADYYLDGLRIISNSGSWLPQVDPFTLDSVEVLRGPSSVLYGQGTGGGIVNQVSRRPQDEAAHEVSLQFGNFARKHIGIDTTGPLNEDRTLLFRFTASGLDTNGQIDDTKHRRLYLAPALTWRPDDKTSWTVMGTYSYEPEIPDYISLPAVLLGLNNSPYREIKRRRNYNDMNFADSTRKQTSVSSFFEHEFDNGWKFTSNSRYMHVNSSLKRSTVYGFSDVGGVPFLKGYYEDAPAESTTFSTDNFLSGEFDIGPTQHKALVGFDYSFGTIKNELYTDGPILFDPYSDDHNPGKIPDFSASRAAPWKVDRDFNRGGIYLQDQISWDNWLLTLGGRRDWFTSDDETWSYSLTSRVTNYDDSAWSRRIGLSYQFDSGLAPYVSYSTAYDPLLENDWKGNPFKPVETKQTEIGIKYSPEGSNMLLSAAIFELKQTNVKTADALHLGFNTQTGEVRTRGIDLQAAMEVTPNINVIAGYTYLDNEILEDTRYEGNSLTQVPKHSASAWVDYRFNEGALAGLKIGGGVRYQGSTFGDPTNSFKVPAETLVDLGLSYDFAQVSPKFSGALLNVNIGNLFDKDYVSSCTSQLYCFAGERRTVSASLSYRW